MDVNWGPMEQAQLTGNAIVAEVLAGRPQTIPVFARHHMACVGCVMAPFETLADVATVYGLPLESFMSELQQEITAREETA